MRLLRLARIALALILAAPLATPCSLARLKDVPFSLNHYVFYGEVVGYSDVPMKTCGYGIEPAQCQPSAGLRIQILEPIQVPGRDITEVEYFRFGIDSMCMTRPWPEEQLRQEYPVGTRVALAASLYTAEEPGSRKIRLTSLVAHLFEAIAVLPKDADPRKLAATPYDYGTDDYQRERFELWRDKLRLQKSRTEREAMSILLRMARSDMVGEYFRDDEYSALEQLVDQYLSTPAVRQEFARQLATRGERRN